MRPSLFLSVLLTTPLGVFAHTHDPADARAPVEPPAYRSVFTDLPRGVETDRDDWRAANINVTEHDDGAHAGHEPPKPADDPHAGHRHGAPK